MSYNEIMESISEELKYVVETSCGPVCGYVNNKEQKSCYKFKGIPYAKPPVGRLRFLPPCPIQPWKEIIDCTKDAPLPLCYSFDYKLVGSEDCLYIEVSTPNVKPDKPLPVMFWIGSYAFAFVIDDILDPTFINEENVVFVRCGFRLGPFGFLSISDFMAPGNNGLKDIVMALTWVQKNIAQFGGDPNNVTIFGGSGGGAIVHMMMLSPMASGLFHKAIIQSASALNNWSLAKNPLQPVIELAAELNITNTCYTDIVEQLRDLPAAEIMKAFHVLVKRKFEQNETDSFDAVFKPCIEQDFEGQPAFLTKSPPVILKSGNFNKVPLIIGSNNIEAAVFQILKNNFYNDFEKYNKNVHLIVPRSLAGEAKISKHVGQQLLKFYLDGQEELTKNTRSQFLQLISDYYFLYYIHKTVQLHSQYTPDYPIYYYVLNHDGKWAVTKNIDEVNCINALGNSSEVPFLFGFRLPGEDKLCKGSRDSVKTRKRVVKMWTNFAIYGNPTPDEDDPLLQIKWDPVENKDKLNYLSIGTELTKGRNPFQERMEFWEELHQEHMFLRVLVYFNDLGVTF
ncbi:juvenile hormone esterase-like [Pectinophora gossypiella]|uniref:juvenile hormone esterase-like n=1 Tax=Pectinophora gossypiella TaxID=13191 RepID=UPI00214E3B47|nr:juvenile hormone esterase-like [Pectinophora gossypiella]